MVITISGRAEAGKDLSAKILKEKFEAAGKRVLIIHYADYLKLVAEKYFQWDGVKDDKGRTLLQWLGTDKVRNTKPNFWVGIVVNLIEVLEDDFDYFLIPDTRFYNEVDEMRKRFNTLAIYVTRLNYTNSLSDEQRKHPSETAFDGLKIFDWYIESETGKDNLEREINNFVEYYNL